MPPVTRSQKIGYKKLQDGWIAKLQILGETNEHRKSVKNIQTAKHRTSKALVLKIFQGEETTNEPVGGLFDENFLYQKGKVVETQFDKRINEVCSTGIHYFKTLECAEMWIFNKRHYTGTIKHWYENGQIEEEFDLKNGHLHGSYKYWYENGQLAEERTYNNDLLVERTLYHKNGKLFKN